MNKKRKSKKRRSSKRKHNSYSNIIGFIVILSVIIAGVVFYQPIIDAINNTSTVPGNGNLGNNPLDPNNTDNNDNANNDNGNNDDITVEYALGDIGPAGGKIFYDKGHYSDGWRYLESDTEDLRSPTTSSALFWGDIAVDTSNEIGSGYNNTQVIVEAWDNSYRDGSNFAAVLANNYTKGGYSDWFLPSKDELILMYTNRHAIGYFTGRYYSSSEHDDYSYFVWTVYFLGGEVSYTPKENVDHRSRGRAIRRF